MTSLLLFGISWCRFILWLYILSAATGADQPVVDTKYGRLRGVEIRSKTSPNVVQAFLSIPYAQPPVGDLRLALPQPPSPWEGERDATRHSPACPQDDKIIKIALGMIISKDTGQSEDCLYLDVYTPGTDGKRPVLIVIHGGAFTFGKTSFLINGVSLSANEDVVVVSIAYRLGVLGNLYSADGAWPSNLGLRDQQFALRWVQDNIAAFGGDRKRVTLNGESAGSMAVSAHILAPSSQGLFQRAVAQSGSIFSPPNKAVPPKRITEALLASLDCPSEFSVAALQCIRQKSVAELLKGQSELPELLFWQQTWDGDFLPVDPFKAYSEGDYSKVDLMTGVTSQEGFVLLHSVAPEVLSSQVNLTALKQEMIAFISPLLTGGDREEDEMLLDTLELLQQSNIDAIKLNVSSIVGEIILQAPTYLAAKLHSANVANTFFYEFAHQPSFMNGLRPSWHQGCDHAFDMVFFFGLPLVDDVPFLADGSEPLTEEEEAFSSAVMKYVANFVKTGNPNSVGLPEWGPFSIGDENYQVLQPNVQGSKTFKGEKMTFWADKVRYNGMFSDKKLSRDEL